MVKVRHAPNPERQTKAGVSLFHTPFVYLLKDRSVGAAEGASATAATAKIVDPKDMQLGKNSSLEVQGK